MKRRVPAILLLGALFCPVVVPAVQAAEGDAIPRDATALCADGTWSPAEQKKGACSSHGGVAYWFKERTEKG